jgi:hypothetical protein
LDVVSPGGFEQGGRPQHVDFAPAEGVALAVRGEPGGEVNDVRDGGGLEGPFEVGGLGEIAEEDRDVIRRNSHHASPADPILAGVKDHGLTASGDQFAQDPGTNKPASPGDQHPGRFCDSR